MVEQCFSDAERLALLKKEMDLIRGLFGKEKDSNDSLNEKLRIKERELTVQYEENDRLKFNYERLKKRMESLQNDIKNKKNSGGGFLGSLFSKSDDAKEKMTKELTLIQDQLTRTIADNGMKICLNPYIITLRLDKVLTFFEKTISRSSNFW